MLGHAYSIGRFLLPVIFIVSGVQKALNVGDVAKMLTQTGIPIPAEIEPYLQGIPRYEAAAYLVAGLEIVCGLMVMLGFLARWGALVLIVFTAATVFFVHDFWTMEGAAAAMHQTQALKNLAIMGGLLLVVAGGSHGSPYDGRRA
jgi:putative oxidoreductase